MPVRIAGCGTRRRVTRPLSERQLKNDVNYLARAIVTDSIAAARSLPADPILGPLSEISAVTRSIMTRVGQALPRVIAAALASDNRLVVLLEERFPLTDESRSATALHARGPKRGERHREDPQVPDHGLAMAIDLAVIELDTRSTTILDVKRGSAPVSSSLRHSLCDRLAAATYHAPGFLRSQGLEVDEAEFGIIDLYGAGGFPPDITVRGDQLDAFFGSEVQPALARFDDALRSQISMRLGLRLTHRPEALAPETAAAGRPGGFVSNPIKNAGLVGPQARRQGSPAASALLGMGSLQ